MKTSIVYTIIALLMINSLSGQVKIGNNPESLNPASVLELESTTRVLVITRVTDAQMNVINPLPGALVYNTDQDCLHYHDGSRWINICEELDNSFTVSTRADYLSTINPQARDSTVVISQTINSDDSINYNFEVGQITGANIVNTSINGASKLQDNSVTNTKLADNVVTFDKLANASAPGDLFIYNGSAWGFINRSDFLNTQLDSIVGNEVVGPFDSTLERLGIGSDSDPFTLDVAVGGINTAELANNAVTTTKIANDAVTTVKILNGNITNAKLDKTNIPLSGFGAAGAAIDLGNQIIFNLGDPTNPLDAVNLQTLNAAIADSEALDNDTDDTNELQNLSVGGGGVANETVEIAISNGTSATFNIQDGDFDPTNENQTVSAGTGINVNQTGQDFQITNSSPDQTVAITDGGSGNVTIGGTYPNFTIDVPDNTDNQNLSVGGGGVANETVEIAISNGTSATFNIQDGDFDPTNENQTVSAGTGINVNQTGQDFQINVNDLIGDVTGPITATQIAAGVITNADINTNAAIDGSKINPVFTTDVTTTGNFVSSGTTLNVPDYVFQKYYTGDSNLDKTYSFRSLSDIESHVKKYNHLPGIKSAKEIKTSGKYNLTQSSLNHLEKIEELFLHTIEQEKKIEQLQSENQNLTKELDSLKEDMAKIKALLMEKSNN
ncbi:MAG: bZIP transcription factor [Algicola sp.]|nr:bZIP transcription factor [Algicola sp.]